MIVKLISAATMTISLLGTFSTIRGFTTRDLKKESRNGFPCLPSFQMECSKYLFASITPVFPSA